LVLNWRDVSYRLQAAGAYALMGVFGVLPLDAASWLGGLLGRRLGPFFGAHRVAVRNLERAMPEKSAAERAAILTGMWDNLGRTVAEYPHLGALLDDVLRVEVFDPANLCARLRDDGLGALLLGMHYGNWELLTVPGYRAGLAQRHFYRAPNNPYVDRLLVKLRGVLRQEGFIPKGAPGARVAVALLRKGEHIGMLVDQKLDEGIAVPFFGRDAMTTTAPAALARRMDVPIVAARVVRQGRSARFKVFVYAFEVAKTENREAVVVVTTGQINRWFEGWVREYPEQWFWVHRRWPKEG
jgi:KDO2-lipid IV(A) lauroyltransferase